MIRSVKENVKRMLGFFTVFILIFSMFNTSLVIQAQDNEQSPIEVNYEIDLGHNGESKDEIVERLLIDGLSYEDANFYAKMDILVAQIKKNNITLDWKSFFKNTKSINKSYVKSNRKQLRKQAVDDKDPESLMLLLSSNDAFEKGQKDLKHAQELFEGNDKRVTKYELTYPDGTSFTFEYGDKKEDIKNDENLKTNKTYLLGPWNESSNFGGSWLHSDNGGEWTSWGEWRYYSSGSYAKVKDTLRWSTTGIGDKYLTILSDEGASSYAGVVTIDTEYLSNSKSGFYQGDHVIQGYTDVVFKVSSSFSAGFEGLSISVDGGTAWHEYCITEILNLGEGRQFNRRNYAGQYL